MQHIHIFLAIVIPWCVFASVTPNYVETGVCEDEQFCSYFYSAQQEYLDNGNNQFTKVNATVDVTCLSSGLYNESAAKLYCMSTASASVFSNSMENSTDDEILAIQQSFTSQLGNWFCFVQTAGGKIPAVYHSPGESDHVISLKKSISAAFQANFEGTDEEEEIDPQSRHTSHYTYMPTGEEGLVKMQRKIRKEDVSELSSEDSMEDIDTAQDEEIQYRSGRLERSSGNTMIHLVNESDTVPIDTVSISQAFSAAGSYSMELKSCRTIDPYMFNIQKNNIQSEMKNNSMEEGLKARVDKKLEAIELMKNLREKLPSGSALKALQNYDILGDKIVQLLLSLVELESQYGPLPKNTPVIDDVILFIPNMPTTRMLREAVFMILCMEGSLQSQMALLNVYDNALDGAERKVILIHISFMKTVRIEFVIGMEERLARLSDNGLLRYQLLLVFGSLAMKGSGEVESRALSFLSAKASSLNSQSKPDLKEIKILIHALGNTGSKLSFAPILSFLNKRYNYNEIKMVVIDALSKVTGDVDVLARLESFLIEDSSIECLAAIIETLQTGYDHMNKTKQGLAQYVNTITSHTLLQSLVEAISLVNSTDLHTMMVEYLIKIDADKAVYDLLYSFTGSLGKRGKRGTTDWDSSLDSDYSYVDALVNRQTHINTYPRHTAYIHSKRIGIDEANIKVAYGYFAGASTTCGQMKAFGRGIVVGKLFTHTSTLVDMKVDVIVNSTSASVIAFLRIGSNTLLDYRVQRSPKRYCSPYNHDLAEFSARLLTLEFSHFVYIAIITWSVHLDIVFDLDVNTNACIGRTGTEVSEAMGALSPTIGVVITGGVTANLVELTRGGIELSASFNYRLEPAAIVQACGTVYCRACIGLYDSFPDNTLRLETWYQIRTLLLTWGERHIWEELSRSWDLGGRGREAVWQDCKGNDIIVNSTTCAGLETTSPEPQMTTSPERTTSSSPEITTSPDELQMTTSANDYDFQMTTSPDEFILDDLQMTTSPDEFPDDLKMTTSAPEFQTPFPELRTSGNVTRRCD